MDWDEWVRELGPEDFYTHHRMHQETFERLVLILKDDIERDVRKVRYGNGLVTTRMQISITLQHLAGSSTHDIKKHMGVSRPSVSVVVGRVLKAIVRRLGVRAFPLDDNEALKKMAEGFRRKSCGKLFRYVRSLFS